VGVGCRVYGSESMVSGVGINYQRAVLYCQTTSSFAGWVGACTLMGLVWFRVLVHLFEQAYVV
jgi:hypothetical protein